MRSAKVVYDDTRKVVLDAERKRLGKDEDLEYTGVPDDRISTTAKLAYRGGHFASDSSVPTEWLKDMAKKEKEWFLRTGDARRPQGRMEDRRV